MAKQLLEDDLWELIEPILPRPKPRRRRYPGRKPISHRQTLNGILFVLKAPCFQACHLRRRKRA
jgi:transposase